MSSVTLRGLAGQSAFRVPIIANAAADLTVTVGGVTAPFTFSNGVVTVTTPLVADADVVIDDAGLDAKAAGLATEETLRTLSGGSGGGATQGVVADGAAIGATKPVIVGGFDGTNAQHLAVTAAGLALVQGSSSSGTTGITGNGFMVGGSDGTNYRNLRLTASGDLFTLGGLTSGGSAGSVTGSMIGGSDGTNYRHLRTNTVGNLEVTAFGTAASGAADSGNPVKVGAKYNATSPTFTDGQRADLQVTQRGSLNVALTDAFGTSAAGVSGSGGSSDGISGVVGALNTRSLAHVFNGTTWDRQYGNVSGMFVQDRLRASYTNESVTPLTSSATLTGTSRDAIPSGSSAPFAYFNGFFLADAAGTAYLEGSNDNSTWYTVATSAVVANTPLILQVPVMTRYHRVKLVNGAGAQASLKVNSSYSAS